MAQLAWITGTAGLIGNQLAQMAPTLAPGFRIRPITRNDLDLTDHAAVADAFAAEQPALIIHCAAMSKSPACQANPALARAVNTDATQHLAKLRRTARSSSSPPTSSSTDVRETIPRPMRPIP